MPGGSVEADAYRQIKAGVLDRLRKNLPWDGVYLDMHGAMNVLGMDDAEGDFIASVRDSVGAECFIAASYDLHGNVSNRVIANLDLLTAYRTAPHIDTLETRQRAVRLLVECLRNKQRPYKAFVPIPVGLPGEKTSTEWEPGASLYAQIPEKIDHERVLDASLLVGYIWADEPRVTACAIAVGYDRQATEDAAAYLAQAYWDQRDQFRFGAQALSVDACLQQALADTDYPVVISDSGDNPTAGGVGDVTYFLQRALQVDVPNLVYASIPDPDAVRRCVEAGVGAELTLDLGGKLDYRHSEPLAVTGRVQFILQQPVQRYGLPRIEDTNRQVVLRTGGIQMIITEKRTAFHHLAQFHALEIDPAQQQILVVKVGYLVPELKALAKKTYLALSPGAVNQAIIELPYTRLKRPFFPFDSSMTWQPGA
jgi:microcystin degradation protein MlrC